MTDTVKFRQWVRFLRRHFPIRTPHRVILGMPAGEPADNEGLCDLRQFPDRIVIYVRSDMGMSHTAGVLIHEWSHAYRADRVPEMGEMDSEDSLHSIFERMIGNRWDQLRGTPTNEEE